MRCGFRMGTGSGPLHITQIEKSLLVGGCVAQLVERSLLIPEVRCSNPVIGKK